MLSASNYMFRHITSLKQTVFVCTLYYVFKKGGVHSDDSGQSEEQFNFPCTDLDPTLTVKLTFSTGCLYHQINLI